MKVGLFVGSFNPVHVGHLIIANHMLNFTDLEEVWFVVSPQNPHKNADELLDEEDRLELVTRSVRRHDRLKASDIELHLPRPSYTINTLEFLAQNHPKIEPVLIIGQDNLDHFQSWKEYEVILERIEIFVYPRRSTNVADGENDEYKSLVAHPKIHLLNAPLLDISSTYVRNCIQEGKDTSFILTRPVLEYIKEKKFYLA